MRQKSVGVADMLPALYVVSACLQHTSMNWRH